jgi:hypothetical protein
MNIFFFLLHEVQVLEYDDKRLAFAIRHHYLFEVHANKEKIAREIKIHKHKTERKHCSQCL